MDKWRVMIVNFDMWKNGRKAKQFRRRVRKGVPDCVRGKVWQMMAGSIVSKAEASEMVVTIMLLYTSFQP